MIARPALLSLAELTLLTDEEFVARWRDLVGKLPAIMLSDRADMIRLLVRSMAPARGALDADKALSVDPVPEGDASIDGWADLFGQECARVHSCSVAGRRKLKLLPFRHRDMAHADRN